MQNLIKKKNHEIVIDKCIYKEDRFFLIDISEELIGKRILSNAVYNGVLNINALYKNFIDDNFQYDLSIDDHKITETTLQDGNVYLSLNALTKDKEVKRFYHIELKPI